MPQTIAGYYKDELTDWKRLITFYNSEMEELARKLGEVIQRNTIPDIAAKVEAQQDSLNTAANKFYRLQSEIQLQEATLTANSTVIDDALISAGTENRQTELRQNMHQAEKDYIDSKYTCLQFLHNTLKKGNK